MAKSEMRELSMLYAKTGCVELGFDSLVIEYKTKEDKYLYPARLSSVLAGNFDCRPFWQIVKEDGLGTKGVVNILKTKTAELIKASSEDGNFASYCCDLLLKSKEGRGTWFSVNMVASSKHGSVFITLTNINENIEKFNNIINMVDHDDLTGLYKRHTFSKRVEDVLSTLSEEDIKSCALVHFDVLRFKTINDLFGVAMGDNLLRYIAKCIKDNIGSEDFASRMGSDRFLIFTMYHGKALEDMILKIFDDIADFDLPYAINCNAGIYVPCDLSISADSMIERSILAKTGIKGSFTHKFNYYTENMRNELLSEQEIESMMSGALEKGQFVPYYQPQYNHTDGSLLGAEALVRWIHPEKGVISPGVFIPIFEKNGFITKLDLYMFEQVCKYLRRCIDNEFIVVPISTNFSRHDVFMPDFVGRLEEIRQKYDVPPKYLRIEITESCVVGSAEQTNDIIRQLHEKGYVIEMDDFGSGYSSLNVLKDIDLDVIKLDMLFIKDKRSNTRGGTILSSVIQMAKWLGLPVIAEGVETLSQADFLRSIGCDYIQGYLYSKPIPEAEFERLIDGSVVSKVSPKLEYVDALKADELWSPLSIETLIFSRYVGGAALFSLNKGVLNVLRVNRSFVKALDDVMAEKEVINSNPLNYLDDKNKKKYFQALSRAIETEDEQQCDNVWCFKDKNGSDKRLYLRSNVHLIGKGDDNYLFYSMVTNLTDLVQIDNM